MHHWLRGHEIWGVVDSGKTNSIFTGKFPKNFDFPANLKKIEFPGKNWPFTATSWKFF